MTENELTGAVLVVTGVMASGKSTVAQLMAERLPRSVHVRGDTFRRMIVTGRADYHPRPSTEALAQLRLRHRLTAATADQYAAAGWAVVVQDVLVGDRLDEFLAALRTRPRYLVVLAPSAASVAARESARGKAGYGPWTVAGLDHVRRHQTPRLGRWLDTTHQTPAETVDDILANLDAARLDH